MFLIFFTFMSLLMSFVFPPAIPLAIFCFWKMCQQARHAERDILASRHRKTLNYFAS